MYGLILTLGWDEDIQKNLYYGDFFFKFVEDKFLSPLYKSLGVMMLINMLI